MASFIILDKFINDTDLFELKDELNNSQDRATVYREELNTVSTSDPYTDLYSESFKVYKFFEKILTPEVKTLEEEPASELVSWKNEDKQIQLSRLKTIWEDTKYITFLTLTELKLINYVILLILGLVFLILSNYYTAHIRGLLTGALFIFIGFTLVKPIIVRFLDMCFSLFYSKDIIFKTYTSTKKPVEFINLTNIPGASKKILKKIKESGNFSRREDFIQDEAVDKLIEIKGIGKGRAQFIVEWVNKNTV